MVWSGARVEEDVDEEEEKDNEVAVCVDSTWPWETAPNLFNLDENAVSRCVHHDLSPLPLF